MSTTPPPPPQQPGAPYGGYPQPPAGGGRLDTADTFDRIFQVYGSQFPVLIGAALLVFVPIAILNGLVYASGSVGLLLIVSVISMIGQALFTGMVVKAVEDIRDGRRDWGVGQLVSAATAFIVPLILAGIVFGIGFVIGLILIIVPGLIFFTFFCLFAPAIVIEGQGVFGSFQRSRDLVRGNAWRVFGVAVVVILLIVVVSSLIQRVFHGISDGFAGAAIGGLVSNLVTAPVFAVAISVLYFQLRDLGSGTQGMYGGAPPPAGPPAYPPQ